MQVINHGNENVLLRDTTKVIYFTHSLGRDLLRTRRHLTEIITSPSRVMGRIRPYAGIGKINFPYGNSPLWLQSIIFLPSWTKQINSKVGISSFITGTDVLKVQNKNRNSCRLVYNQILTISTKANNYTPTLMVDMWNGVATPKIGKTTASYFLSEGKEKWEIKKNEKCNVQINLH